MNGEDLPWLNVYPLRLVVPGHYGTYWVKHLNENTVLTRPQSPHLRGFSHPLTATF